MILVSAVALMDEFGQILMQKRPAGDPHQELWEFPGGKVESDEDPIQALYRECLEELGISLDRKMPVPVGFSYEERIGKQPILILLYLCRRWSGTPEPHFAAELQWVQLDKLDTLELVPADISLVAQLQKAVR